MNINIAVDHDEILANLLDQLILFHYEEYGTNLKREDFTSYNFHEVWGGTPQQAIQKMEDFFKSKYFKEVVPTGGSQEAMGFLKRKGHNLFIVTGRIHSLTEETLMFIEKYFPNIFSGISFANSYGTSGPKMRKSVICRKLNVRLIIEDDPIHIADCANDGIPVFIYDKPWNQGILPEKAIRVFNWSEMINEISSFALKVKY
jgi:uncharacterized HAD superfamily protein